MNVKMNLGGREFWASARQAVAIEVLTETQKGGFASVKGYKNKQGEVADHTVLSRLSVSRLYERKIAALQALTFDAVLNQMLSDPNTSNKMKALSLADLEATFTERRQKEIDSMQKTLDGVRDDARRQGIDRNFHNIGEGVRVHFKSETDADGLKQPVLVDGLPIVESIMLFHVNIKKNVLTEGVYKTVNSGVPVLMSNAMEDLLPKSTKLKQFSLKEDNFESISIDHQTIMPSDIAGDFT